VGTIVIIFKRGYNDATKRLVFSETQNLERQRPQQPNKEDEDEEHPANHHILVSFAVLSVVFGRRTDKRLTNG
jgi:hypothetical protein